MTHRPRLLCALLLPFLGACDDHPELRATRDWLVLARAEAAQAAMRRPIVQSNPLPSMAALPEAPAPHSDPFSLAAAMDTTSAASTPPPPPPLPALRALGVLQRAGQSHAILQIDQRILRLQAGQALPGIGGRVLRVTPDLVELRVHDQPLLLRIGAAPETGA